MEPIGSADRTFTKARPRPTCLALLALAVGACGGAASDDPAQRCAEFVRAYRGLESGVEVVGSPVETSEGSVAIRWRGAEPGNLPVEGRAECTFAVGDAGELTLAEASVDGEPVDPHAIGSPQDPR